MLEGFHPSSNLVAMRWIGSAAFSCSDWRDLLPFLPPEAESHTANHGVTALVEQHQAVIGQGAQLFGSHEVGFLKVDVFRNTGGRGSDP